ncbi:MAG: T9SS type A sorting domain-containing protein [Candidatus Oleimicrobiaceae bacterium]
MVSGGLITALAMAKAEPRRLYYATFNWTENGRLYKLNNPHIGQPTPVEITGRNFPYYPYCPSIGCIAVDPRDANKLLVVFPNYRVISIYASDDGGGSWSAVAGNLEEYPDGSGSGPSVRWVSILYVQDRPVYFATTSVGLFSTTELNGMNTVWGQEGSHTIGNVVVDMIDVRQSDGFVAVGTHGNGLYSTYVTELPSGVEEVASRSWDFILHPAYPNPFNAWTRISFQVPVFTHVALKVYDLSGKEATVLVDEEKQPGTYEVRFDGENLPSGVYVYCLKARGFQTVRKMVLVR